MKHQQEVHSIKSINYFLNYIRIEATNTFLMTFQNTKEFIDTFEDTLLTDKIVLYEANRYIFENPEGENWLIYHEDIEKVIKIVYKELVEKVLNKLVDEGILEMLWDTDKMEVIWKKKKGVHVSRRIKKLNGRKS
jgi:hypothetical protein